MASPRAAATAAGPATDFASASALISPPVALVGFVLALFLREVPMRDIHNSAVDIGDGFGMPTIDTPERLLENAIARLLRGDSGLRLRSIAMRPDCRRNVAGLWGVMRIYRYGQMYGTARLSDIGDNMWLPFEVLESTFSRLVAGGYVQRDGDQMWPALEHVAHQVLAQRDWYDDRPASTALGAIPLRAA